MEREGVMSSSEIPRLRVICLAAVMAWLPCLSESATAAGKSVGRTGRETVKQPDILPDDLRIQVAWTLVRSRVTAYGATSRNENFRETWHLVRRSAGAGNRLASRTAGGRTSGSPRLPAQESEATELEGAESARDGMGQFALISPRGRVAVHLATPDQSLVMTEGGLANLLGLLPQQANGGNAKFRGNQVAAALARPVAIQLREPRSPVQSQYKFGDEESLAVSLEIQGLKSDSSNP